jgi:TRAP-type C4-dicarboxylate transport system substrate-binding protein
VAVSCGGTKAGGRPLQHTSVLTIADPETDNRDLAEYIAAVRQLSNGSISLERRGGWRGSEIDYDRGTVADVRAGKVDLAKIDVGSLDTLGFRPTQALTAPFLVDSLDLEQKVLESPLPDEMLAGLGRLDVVGVSLLPGEPLRPFGQRRRFRGAASYRGALFGTTSSHLAAATLKALGARPRGYVSHQLGYAFAGAELDLATIEDANYDTSVTSVTDNVVFAPRAFVVVANPSIFARLTKRQREILREAGRVALTPAIARLRREDLDEAGILCARGQLTFVKATGAQVASLHAAVRPVYQALERHPETRSLISKIEAMRRRLPSTRPVSCGHPLRRERAVTPLDGTWEMTTPAHGIDAVDAGHYRLVLRRGKFALFHLSPPRWGGRSSGDAGIFSVRGDTVVLRSTDGVDNVYRWNVFRQTLTFGYTRQIGAPNPTYAPWHWVGH